MNIEDLDFKNLILESKNRKELWEVILKSTNVKTMAEIGVWKGDFAKDVLKNCELINRYYMIDPWKKLHDWNKPFNVDEEQFDDVYNEAMQKTEFASQKIVVLRGRTKEVIDDIPDESLDFAYIDGDHTLRGISIDLIKLLPKMKDNAFIGGDDFINNPWQHDNSFEPTLVCPFSVYFSEANDLPFIALPFQQFLIQKRKVSGFVFVDLTGDYADISLNKLHITV